MPQPHDAATSPQSDHADAKPQAARAGETKVTSKTPEGANGGINPSAPGETGTSAKK